MSEEFGFQLRGPLCQCLNSILQKPSISFLLRCIFNARFAKNSNNSVNSSGFTTFLNIFWTRISRILGIIQPHFLKVRSKILFMISNFCILEFFAIIILVPNSFLLTYFYRRTYLNKNILYQSKNEWLLRI